MSQSSALFPEASALTKRFDALVAANPQARQILEASRKLPGLPSIPAEEITAHIDFETRATVDLKLGVYKYAEHHATQVLCLGYRIGNGDVRVWKPLKGEPFPQELIDHVKAGRRVVAHNMAFDRIIWNFVLRRDRPDIPELMIEQCDCTMIRALALGLPGGLDAVCKALRLPFTKNLEGYKVMMKLCKPQKVRGQLVWNNDPALFEILYQYCGDDIRAESPIDDALPRLSEEHQRKWFMSERINERGIYVDFENVKRAALVVEAEGKSLSLTVKHLTRGFAEATQRGKLLEWVQDHNIPLEDMKKHSVRDLLKTEIKYDHVKAVLNLQTEANKTSTAKLKKMAARACKDGRVRGEYRFCGAGTGRYSSTGIQMHNFSRPSKGFKLAHADDVLAWLQYDTPQARSGIRMEHGSVMLAVSNTLRPLLMAAPGNEYKCADYSNIEGRIAAWLAGEEWKLDAFRDYDTITGYDAKGEPIRLGPDLYILAFARAFGVKHQTVDDDQRQVGKVIELSAQYQSGHGGFLAMAANYDVDARTVAEVVRGQTSPEEWARFEEMYDAKGAQHFELDRFEWTGVKILINNWREANSKIKAIWKLLEDAAVDAVKNPGKITCVDVGHAAIHFGVWDNALWMRLPSGRKLCYKYPSITQIDTPWGHQRASVRVFGTEKGAFLPYHLHGGLLFENCLAGDSLVLTRRGWIELQHIQNSDLVFDGVEFVTHGGLIAKGTQQTIEIDGVRMTPDHKLLTIDGWRNASSCSGFERAAVRLPDSAQLCGFQRQQIALERPLRLRRHKSASRIGAAERARALLRMSARQASGAGSTHSRHELPSRVSRLARYGRKVLAAYTSGLAQLRRTRHICLCGVVRFRDVLAGYGAFVSVWPYARSSEQQWPLHTTQLSVDYSEGSRAQHARQRLLRNAAWPIDSCRDGREERYRRNDVALSAESRGDRFGAVVTAGHAEQVFDILNCGPRHRFVVLGTKGPFIAHNCVQAIAADLLNDAMENLETAGYPIVLHTHDECAAETPIGHGSLEAFCAIMRKIPSWAAELPVSVAGWVGQRYRKG